MAFPKVLGIVRRIQRQSASVIIRLQSCRFGYKFNICCYETLIKQNQIGLLRERPFVAQPVSKRNFGKDSRVVAPLSMSRRLNSGRFERSIVFAIKLFYVFTWPRPRPRPRPTAAVRCVFFHAKWVK